MSDRQGKWNTKRFPYRKNDNGENLCRICGKPTKRNRTCCDVRCWRDFFMQTDWQRVRRVVYERDGGLCMKCGKKVDKKSFHVDHIIPLSKGGPEWDLNNLELSCIKCNLEKGGKIPEEGAE